MSIWGVRKHFECRVFRKRRTKSNLNWLSILSIKHLSSYKFNMKYAKELRQFTLYKQPWRYNDG